MKWLFGPLAMLVYAATSCTGLYLLKTADGWFSLRFASGGVLYVAGAAIWICLLRLLPLSVAFPIASGMLMLGTTLTGYFLLDERLSAMQGVGIVLILSGMVFVGANIGKS
ncbi:SMR family transporter [Pandoraea norimbergensis]|uniref:EamA domain-containing protein n=1 Tax=Pandoraea norimbergensis TaxID=93219 RepID=A0ABN4JFA8_9BURK|nr:SMR family transporter [Pandoraea norimbergensis]ALS59537.1 hypothetical protein AT302_07000 [Pandoraea norimbergensis]